MMLDMENTDLSKKKCTVCTKDTLPLKGEKLKSLYDKLQPGWKLIDEHRLEKEYTFKDFKQALAFTNRVGEMAEHERHHPDLHLSWGKVKIELWTHKINGLSENDFIMAAKCDDLS
jgi:4a-hydroxytetrahydrobiopterin dehydratase